MKLIFLLLSNIIFGLSFKIKDDLDSAIVIEQYTQWKDMLRDRSNYVNDYSFLIFDRNHHRIEARVIVKILRDAADQLNLLSMNLEILHAQRQDCFPVFRVHTVHTLQKLYATCSKLLRLLQMLDCTGKHCWQYITWNFELSRHFHINDPSLA